jgi:hypothetical protein
MSIASAAEPILDAAVESIMSTSLCPNRVAVRVTAGFGAFIVSLSLLGAQLDLAHYYASQAEPAALALANLRMADRPISPPTATCALTCSGVRPRAPDAAAGRSPCAIWPMRAVRRTRCSPRRDG